MGRARPARSRRRGRGHRRGATTRAPVRAVSRGASRPARRPARDPRERHRLRHRTSAAADRELQRLRGDAGVRIALDDFGRDSSTLVSIVRYPLDVLKLDRTLTLDLVERKPQLVVESIALLTDRLDVEMVAEGVEDDETCELLRAIGVRYMQGYRFGTALPAAAMAERLTTHGLLARLP
ncbi:EAL domain-containing protein [Salana multivorans]|uniref:EAL domain-containing protein n=1 Tax=Salana multivorans TaxID=120377 RepID=UPI0014762DD9|nr:EAL domain-containing protein [Salana multivorans]